MTRDAGAGAVAVLGVAATVVALAVALIPIASISVSRHRAAVAADASALAAAAAVAGLGSQAGEDPCAAGSALAARHGAVLGGCIVDGLVVTVEAAVETVFGPVAARATAGPPGAR